MSERTKTEVSGGLAGGFISEVGITSAIMRNVKRMLTQTSEWIKYAITWGLVRILYGPMKKDTYEAHGESETVYWIDSEDHIAGWCTPVGTIVLNEGRLANCSVETRDYVFLHELGHKHRHPLLHAIFYAIAIPGAAFALASVMTLVSLAALYFQGVVTNPWAFVGVLATFVLSIAVISGISKLEELAAEVFSVNRIGEEAYVEAWDELEEKSAGGLIVAAKKKLLYPGKGAVCKVYSKLYSA